MAPILTAGPLPRFPGVNLASPDLDSPEEANPASRTIPDRACVEFMLVPSGQSNFSALPETWETSTSIRAENGHRLAFFDADPTPAARGSGCPESPLASSGSG